MKLNRLMTVFVWLAGGTAGLAVERYVPYGGALSYSNIQEALLASAAGDVIRVQPGIYQGPITLPRKDLVLTSLDPVDWKIVQATILQGDGSNSVISCLGQLTTNTLVTGFTIRGGGGRSYVSGSSRFRLGGGVYCYQSSPSLVGNIIEDNRLDTNEGNIFYGGGGISSWGGSPFIARNILRHNTAYVGGAILTVTGSPRIQDNWIYHNTAQAGGGAYVQDQGLFLNNTVTANGVDNLYVESTAAVMNNIITEARGEAGVLAGLSSGDISKWFRYNNVWGNEDGNFMALGQTVENGVLTVIRASVAFEGRHGNLSADPLFASVTNRDFRLNSPSPCVNAGALGEIRSADETDLDGQPRIFALRIDMGATEFHGNRNYPPVAQGGTNRTVYWAPGGVVALDGSASDDPDGDALRFEWRQVGGSPVILSMSNTVAYFTPTGLGSYRFELVVNDGTHSSAPGLFEITITNLPPLASAGLSQSMAEIPETVILDGSHSLDPEGEPLVYEWRQTGGPSVAWSNPQTARPSFKPQGPGVYLFELVVKDHFSASLPSQVAYYLGQAPPIAQAGPTRYAGRSAITLDGSRSFAPNNPTPLEFSWRQRSGPALIFEKTNTAFPMVRGFQQLTNNAQEAVFELVVRAGSLISQPDTVKVVIVPSWSNASLSLQNPPFRPELPTVVGFGGGNCDTGGSMSFPSSWRPLANLFTTSYNRDRGSPANAPVYFGYGDQLITMLSSNAPDYDQPIQTMGFSTGAMPACDLAERFNITYRDPRYVVTRITFLDSGCEGVRNYFVNLGNLMSHRMPGKPFWVDNNYSSAGRFRPGTLNIEFPVPPADHSTPNNWYFPSWNMNPTNRLTNFNQGIFGGAFFSVVGPGRNYQLGTSGVDYHFGWPGAGNASFPVHQLVQVSPVARPARLPGLVELDGPEHGSLIRPGQAVFSCRPVLNAVKYQILVGPAPRQLEWVAWEGPTPPTHPLTELPFATNYWTVRAFDADGASSQADPAWVYRDTDGDSLSDAIEFYGYGSDPDRADSDGDGRPDGQEALAGTNPRSALDSFHFGFQRMAPNQLLFSWFVEPGQSYDLEFSPSLRPPAWQWLETIQTTNANGFIQRAITLPINSGPAGFYRLHAPGR